MIIANLIYILQSENYNFLRFLKFVYKNLNWFALQKRQKIVWTSKARFLQVITWINLLAIIFLSAMLLGQFAIVGIFYSVIFLPFILGLSLIVTKPIDAYLKRKKKNKATNILAGLSLTVVGITGSYGKTSTKEILAELLKNNFRLIKTPENINTDLGIAQFIIDNQDVLKEADIFVVEMGAYKRGDIKKICEMVSPDYAILTGINESHLERFGSIENTISAKFELPESAKKVSIINLEDNNIKNNYDKFNIKKVVGVSFGDAEMITVKESFEGMTFEYKGNIFETKLLAKHNIILILMCLKITEELSISVGDLKKAVSGLTPIAHRLEPLHNKNTGVMVIDDSYNGNFDGIRSGLEVLSRAKGRKLILTPGLVELGEASDAIHEEIGKLYAKVADKVLLIKSPMTDSIISGMEKENFRSYQVYENTTDAHADLSNVVRSGDTIIFQNDLTDNYF